MDLLLMPLLAAPVLHFARVDERIRVGTFYEVREEYAAEAVWKKSSGAYRAWTFRDRRVVRAEHREKSELLEVVRYDVTGRAESRVRYEQGTPVEVVVDGGTVDIRSWEAVTVGPLTLTLPPGVGHRRTDGDAIFDAILAPTADIFSPQFATDLEAQCDCKVHSGATTWIGAKPAARFAAELRSTDDRQTAELWAIPMGNSTLLVASSAPAWNEHTMLRAAMALYDLELSR